MCGDGSHGRGRVMGALLTPPHSTEGFWSLPHQGVLLSLLWPEPDTDDGEWQIEGCPTKGPAEGGSVGVFPDDGACNTGAEVSARQSSLASACLERQ